MCLLGIVWIKWIGFLRFDKKHFFFFFKYGSLLWNYKCITHHRRSQIFLSFFPTKMLSSHDPCIHINHNQLHIGQVGENKVKSIPTIFADKIFYHLKNQYSFNRQEEIIYVKTSELWVFIATYCIYITITLLLLPLVWKSSMDLLLAQY